MDTVGFAWVVLLAFLRLVNDAHLAGLALEHGAEVGSFDSDFARFGGVRWRTSE
ncbi:MAG TPA: hypothetical protein VK988_22295 [Acidimicrobiales bacterium]|nr:hypothetical protein [Acidimicrobiales bacterium]